jgi:hypothetical protein
VVGSRTIAPGEVQVLTRAGGGVSGEVAVQWPGHVAISLCGILQARDDLLLSLIDCRHLSSLCLVGMLRLRRMGDRGLRVLRARTACVVLAPDTELGHASAEGFTELECTLGGCLAVGRWEGRVPTSLLGLFKLG